MKPKKPKRILLIIAIASILMVGVVAVVVYQISQTPSPIIFEIDDIESYRKCFTTTRIGVKI